MARRLAKLKASYLVDQLDKYVCPKCDYILTDPVQTSCGHWLCQDCAEESKTKYPPSCPACGKELVEFFPDRCVRSEVNSLLVVCQCDWKGSVGDFCDDHREKCPLHVAEYSIVTETSCQETMQTSIGQHTKLVISHGAMVASAPPSSSFRIPQSHNSGVPPRTKRFVVISSERSGFPDHKVSGTIGMGETGSEGETEGGVKIEEEAGSSIQARRRSSEATEMQAEMAKKDSQLVQTLQDEVVRLKCRVAAIERNTFIVLFPWKIQNVSKCIEDARTGKCISMDSPPFLSNSNGCGYKMCLRLYMLGDGIGKGTHMSLFFVVMKGEFDNFLQWPFTHKVTFKLINKRGGCDVVESIHPDLSNSSFHQPKSDMNVASGCPRFVSIKELLQEGFIVDDTIFIKAEVDTSDGVNQAL